MDAFEVGASNYLANQNSPMPGQMAQMPTMRLRLEMAVKRAEDQLAAVKEAKEIFDRNPDVERLLDLMQRSHF